jgi:hypothetical protein
MRLYHGTSATRLDDILTNGIRPRLKTASNWGKCPSRPDMVYLTLAYPLYFAMNPQDKRIAVVEIDFRKLDEDLLYPDEDFVAQARHGENDGDFDTIHREVRESLEDHRSQWRQSIMRLGNCCYKGVIPSKAITRYCIFDVDARPDVAFEMLTPVISMTNFAIKGRDYMQFVDWMFGDRKTLPMIQEVKDLPEDYPDREKALVFWRKQSKDRTGIEVVQVRHGR